MCIRDRRGRCHLRNYNRKRGGKMKRGTYRTAFVSLLGALSMFLITGLSFAGEALPPAGGSEPPKVEAPAPAPAAPSAAAPAPKIDKGDTAWMLTSAAYVLMMTIPAVS